MSVEQYMASAAKALGGKRHASSNAVRFEKGEGIEKKQEDFAAEVAAQMNAGHSSFNISKRPLPDGSGRFALFAGIKVRLGPCAQAADGVCQAFCFLREQAGGDGCADGEDLVAAAVGVLAAVEQVQGRIAHICQRRFTRSRRFW